jgi:hypothetical protein
MDDLNVSTYLDIGDTWHTGEHPSYPDAHCNLPLDLSPGPVLTSQNKGYKDFLDQQ